MVKAAGEPVEQRFVDEMQQLARALDATLNGDKKGKDRDVGFVLLVFGLGDAGSGRCNYISNADRDDIVVLMKEMIARFEGQPEQSGRA